MRRTSDPDLVPLPRWRQHQRAMVAWWRRTRDRRRTALHTTRKLGRQGFTLAISMLGATLISYGVYQAYPPAGYIVGGLLLWGVQWNYGEEKVKGEPNR